MEGVSDVYYQQSILCQPRPITPPDPPVLYSAAINDDQGMNRLLYEDLDPSLQMFNLCYQPSFQCGQPLVDTPLQQWTQHLEDPRILSHYLDHIPSVSSSVDRLSPGPPELTWSKPHSAHGNDQARAVSRAASFTSNSSGWNSCPHSEVSRSEMSRSASPNASEMARWGQLQEQGTWRCAYPGCTSKSIFRRGCDLRKHYRRHTKSLFCRYKGCKQASEGGFSSEKDRARHEAKHNPQIACEWTGCSRVFSRVDNMRDHVRRIHRRKH